MAITYTPITTQTLASNETSIVFSSITSIYTDLRLVISGFILGDVYIRFNSDNSTNYSQTVLASHSSSLSGSSSRVSNTSTIYSDFYGGYNGVVPAQITWDIMRYSNTTTYKSILGRSGIVSAQPAMNYAAMMWRSTSAINTISLAGGTFNAGLTATLYGIKAA